MAPLGGPSSEAVALFSGDFLEGFSLRDSPEFDDWQIREAGALERELASALRRLIALLVARGDFERAHSRARSAGSSSIRSTSRPTES